MKKVNLIKNIFFTVSTILIFAACAYSQSKQKIYTIGVSSDNHGSGKQSCDTKWNSTARYLSDKIEDAEFKIVAFEASELKQAVLENKVDFLIINPYIYIELEMDCGIERIATMKKLVNGKVTKLYGNTIAALANRDDIGTLSSLKGKVIALASTTLLDCSMPAKRELNRQNVKMPDDFKQLIISGTCQKAIYTVKGNLADAAIVRTGILECMAAKENLNLNDFKVLNHEGPIHYDPKEEIPFLHSTRLYSEWPFAKTAKADSEISEKVLTALLSIQPDNLCAVLGGYAGWTVPMSYESTRDCLKELRAGPYKNYGQITIAGIFHHYGIGSVVFAVLVLVSITTAIITVILNSRLNTSQKSLKTQIYEKQKARQQLQSSTQMLQLVMDNIPQFVFWKDLNSVYIGCNKNFAKAAGLNNPEEIKGKTDYDLAWKKEESDFYRECDRKVMDANTSMKNIIEPQRDATGNDLWLNTNKIPLHDNEGNVIGILGTYEDTTERKLAEESKAAALERISRQQAAIFELSTNQSLANGDLEDIIKVITKVASDALEVDRVSVWMMDKDYQNLRCADLYDRESAKHSKGMVLSVKAHPVYFEEMRKGLPIDAVDAHRDPRTCEFCHDYLTPEGIKSLLDTAIRIGGRIIGVICCEHKTNTRQWTDDEIAFVDKIANQASQAYMNHERKIHEENVTKSRKVLQTILDSMPFGIIVSDKDEKIRKLNNAALTMSGYKEKWLLVGNPCQKILCPAQKDGHLETDTSALHSQCEKTLITKDGNKIPILKSDVPIKIDNEDMTLECFVDITTRKKIEEKLQYSLSLLQNTLESTADGILVVDNNGKIRSYNQKFIDMWKIPIELVKSGDDEEVLAAGTEQTLDPKGFYEKVQYLYAHKELDSFDLIEFKDGRVFERYSQPHRLGDEIVGRVWSFRDVTGKENIQKQTQQAHAES